MPTLKKAERKEALKELYVILKNGEQNDTVCEAREKVVTLLSHDGFYIFEDCE